MSKHTPGPWELVENDTGAQRVFAGSVYIGDVYNSDMQKDKILSNARLIAASPDLLEACKIILDGYDNRKNDEYFDWLDAEKKIRSATAKAEGTEDA